MNPKFQYQPINFSNDFGEDEMIRDWTLSDKDIKEVQKYKNNFRLYISIQLCVLRRYGRFAQNVNRISPRIISYLTRQLNLSVTFRVEIPKRDATLSQQRASIMSYLEFSKYNESISEELKAYIFRLAKKGNLPSILFQKSESFLLDHKIILPGVSLLERLISRVFSKVHEDIFKSLSGQLPKVIKRFIDNILDSNIEESQTIFQSLKESPPTASIKAIKLYLSRYVMLVDLKIDQIDISQYDKSFLEYLYKLAHKYNAKEMKRFADSKRYALMICFLFESHKVLLDHLVKMHDEYMTDLLRRCKNRYENKHKQLRKSQKKAVETMLSATANILNLPSDKTFTKRELLEHLGEVHFIKSVEKLKEFKKLTQNGHGNIILNMYSSLRRYFCDFITLPFRVKVGSEPLLKSIELLRRIDNGVIAKIPNDTPIYFIPKELKSCLYDNEDNIRRSAWELGIAIAIKDALRSGDLYIPQSKYHISFWDLMIDPDNWNQEKDTIYETLQQPSKDHVKSQLAFQFHHDISKYSTSFLEDDFAEIQDGKLKPRKEKAVDIPNEVKDLQRIIDSNLPSIRIEELLLEVDKELNFSRHFTPIQEHNSRPKNFYKTLIAALISQATNIGVVAMSSSIDNISVDMLRYVLKNYIREDTLNASSAEIVNIHSQLPLGHVHGKGEISSSDAQRFKVRASSLITSYFPRYYGYYEKAIGIYTHVSDKYSVYNTQVISCKPREAMYVLDGLLENNTILNIKKHTTDTHGYTEIVFALCHLLGFYFMPRIKDLKEQQLYKVDREIDYGVFGPLLTKTVDLDIIEEQWDNMMLVAQSLKEKTAPAHIVVERLTKSYPLDRLSKAFTMLGRIIKTGYILNYISSKELRRTVQLQLNKGEYRHTLPRWIFFANQGEFTTGDYLEIMNKSSVLSLVSNAILYWNTKKIQGIVSQLKSNGYSIDDEILSHISLLPYKHILPNGTYFNVNSG